MKHFLDFKISCLYSIIKGNLHHTTTFQYLLAIFKCQNLKYIIKLIRLKMCLSCLSASLGSILYYTLCSS